MVKDRIVSWFLKNVVMSRQGNIEDPGFITMKSSKGKKFRRQILLPEEVIEEIENVAHERGLEDSLYSVGKKFGWRFISTYDPKTVSETKASRFEKQVYFLVRFVGSTFASKADHSLDLDKKTFEIEAENYIVCRNNGFGDIMSRGGIPGVWAYLMEDKKIEGIKTHCEGRGDEKCDVIAAPRNELSSRGLSFSKEENLSGIEMAEDYTNLNKNIETKYADNSLKDLIDSGFFDYEKGVISKDGKRYFLVEIGLTQLLGSSLEDEIKDIAYKSAFKHGEDLAKSEKDNTEDYRKFITEFLSASGWGDARVKENEENIELSVRTFPWTRFSKEIDFPVFRGLSSGLISGFHEENLNLNLEEQNSKGKGLTVTLKASFDN